MNNITLFRSGCGYYRGNIRISWKYPCSLGRWTDKTACTRSQQIPQALKGPLPRGGLNQPILGGRGTLPSKFEDGLDLT